MEETDGVAWFIQQTREVKQLHISHKNTTTTQLLTDGMSVGEAEGLPDGESDGAAEMEGEVEGVALGSNEIDGDTDGTSVGALDTEGIPEGVVVGVRVGL